MDERVMQFRVGVMVLATLDHHRHPVGDVRQVAELTVGTYRVQVRFDNAGGITKGTPVRKSGILIGRVADVELTDDDREGPGDARDPVGQDHLPERRVLHHPRSAGRHGRSCSSPIATSVAPHVPIEPEHDPDGQVSDDPTGLKRALQGPIDTVQETGEALTEASKKLGAAAERVEDILNDRRPAKRPATSSATPPSR